MRKKIAGISLVWKINALRFSDRAAPWIFLLALVFAFGLLISALGIYQDDWSFVYSAYAVGPFGIQNFMYYDGTPLAALINNLQFYLLGFRPLSWHVFSLAFRWLTVCIFWLVFRQIWPGRPRQAFFAALIFAIHPFFSLQSMAFTYAHVWVAYFLMGLSYYWMILAVRQPGRTWLYLPLSILMGVAVMLTGEYFAGFEFLRPLLLYTLPARPGWKFFQRVKRTLQYWAAYAVLLGTYLYWRFFVYQVPIENRNAPNLVIELLHDPLGGVATILLHLIPDTVLLALSSWYNVLTPAWLDFSSRGNQAALLLCLFALGIFFYVFQRRQAGSEEKVNPAADHWPAQAFWFGLAVLVFGLIPPYVGGLYLNDKNPLWNSRLGMASMLGAALMAVAVIEKLIADTRSRNLVFALLVALSIGKHFRTASLFAASWEKNLNFYTQLVQRMPGIEPETSIFSSGEFLSAMGDYPTSYALNTMYANPRREYPDRLKYWFYILPNDRLGSDQMLFSRHRSMKFQGRGADALIVSFEPELGQCMRVLTPRDATVRAASLDEALLTASRFSNLTRIQPDAQPGPFLSQVLGIDPTEISWCSIYQQAERSRQAGDWEQIARLYQQAVGSGLYSGEVYEYLPFVEAFIRLGDFETAYQISFRRENTQADFRKTVCSFWNYLLANDPTLSRPYQQIGIGDACGQ